MGGAKLRLLDGGGWRVRYYTFDDSSRPDKNPKGFARVVAGAPVKSDRRDKLDYIIQRWTVHESAVDTAPIPRGKRRFNVEYYEAGGFAELRFEILRR